MRRLVLGSCFLAVAAVCGCGSNSTLDLATPTPDETATPTPVPDPCTVAGNVCAIGTTATVTDGDGGPALQAYLAGPRTTAMDGDGNLYIAETFAHRIRKIDTSGTITTIAGVGHFEWPVATGMPSELTPVNSPNMLAASDDGWLYWGGWDEPVIYGRDPDTGVVVVVAGDGSWDVGQDGPALEVPAYLDWRGALATDAAGNLYMADYDDHVVRVLNRQAMPITIATQVVDPGEIETIAGNGAPGSCANNVAATSCGLANPGDVFVHADGSVIIADTENHRIRRVTSDGNILTIAGTGTQGGGGDGGLAISATFNHPHGITSDAAGRLFVLDENMRVRLVNYSGAATVWGGVSVANNEVETVAGTGAYYTFIEGDGGPGLDAGFAWEQGSPLVDANGDLVITDTWSMTVRRLDATDGTLSVMAGLAGRGDAASYQPWVDSPAFLGTQLVYSPGTPFLYALSLSTGERTRLAGTGETTLTGEGGPAIDAGAFPDSLAVAGNTIVFADSWNLFIREIDSLGDIHNIAGTGNYVDGGAGNGGLATAASFDACEAIAADAAGNLFVLDDDQIRFINRGTTTVTIGSVMITAGEIERIAGVSGANSFSGDGGSALLAEMNTDYQTHMVIAGNALFFTDFHNHRIRRIDLGSGVITTFAGNGTDGYRGDGDLPANAWTGWPTGIAVKDGFLYWSQEAGAVIRRAPIDGNGPVETIAGNGVAGYAASGVPARETSFLWPSGMTFAPDGSLVFADGTSRLFRVVLLD